MNNKTTINTYLSTIESKSKLSEEEQNRGYGEHFDGCYMGGWCGGEWMKR